MTSIYNADVGNFNGKISDILKQNWYYCSVSDSMKEIAHIAIVGAGAAGLQLALEICRNTYFDSHSILIFEPEDKVLNDKTWSYWEKGKGHYGQILTGRWNTGSFYGNGNESLLHLKNYEYKTLRSSDFYAFAKKTLSSHTNVTWIKEKVHSIDKAAICQLNSSGKSYYAELVFDSRFDEKNLAADKRSTKILQHFSGWFITTKSQNFDPSRFVMMDFRYKEKASSSFMYLLPFSETEALLEFTYFNEKLVEQEVYDKKIQEYLSEELHIDEYEIVEKEYGLIPMTDFNFTKDNTSNYIKIGTAGGWVKASTGYSFKNSSRYSKVIVDNIMNGKPVNSNIHNRSYAFYDSIFLDVLSRRNDLGERIFSDLYSKVEIERLFQFLDEELSFLQIMRLFSKLPTWPFLVSFFRKML